MPKQIYLADVYGFCFGVKRALDIALEQKTPAVTLGKLIHNNHVIEELKAKGIGYIESLKQAEGTVIIRAHGVPRQVVEKAKKLKLNVVDATCPLVKNVHMISKQLEEEGCQVVIVGDKSHVEVIAITSYLKNPIVIGKPEQVKELAFYDKIGVVCQTTQSQKNFEEIAKELKPHCNELKAINTICKSTEQRQTAALELSKKVDIMIVVGDQQSNNTRMLAELCSNIVQTEQVEDAAKLKPEWFDGKEKIGITAGASTPDRIVQDVIAKIKEL
jgi:(E)-4-hydroxy-3-methyl-but-2-enyl pyrophosphate reductase